MKLTPEQATRAQVLMGFVNTIRSPCCDASLHAAESSSMAKIEIRCVTCESSMWIDLATVYNDKLHEALYIGLRDWTARAKGEAGRYKDVN